MRNEYYYEITLESKQRIYELEKSLFDKKKVQGKLERESKQLN